MDGLSVVVVWGVYVAPIANLYLNFSLQGKSKVAVVLSQIYTKHADFILGEV